MLRDLFISYAGEDEKTATGLCRLLEEAGLSCWIASRDLVGGERWGRAIVEALSQSRALIVLVSPDSNASKQVAREVEFADSKGLPLVAVRLSDVAPAGEVAFFLHNTHWLDAFPGPLEEHAPGIARQVRDLLGIVVTGSTEPQSAVRRWLRRHRRKLGIGVVGATAVILALMLPQCRDGHRIRVTVLDAQGRPTDEAVIRMTAGGEIKKAPGGWEIEVPRASKPADDRVTIYASLPNAFLKGSREVRLGRDCVCAVSIHLQPEPATTVRGTVVDSGGRPIPAARVSVAGYETEAVLTGPGGEFELPAHAAEGEQVLLRVNKDGFPAVDQRHFAGWEPATIALSQ